MHMFSNQVLLYFYGGFVLSVYSNPRIKSITIIEKHTILQTCRCISVFNGQRQGFAVGSVEGRVEIKDLGDATNKKSFAFKCHRQKDNAMARGGKDYHHVYPVNAICFNRYTARTSCTK